MKRYLLPLLTVSSIFVILVPSLVSAIVFVRSIFGAVPGDFLGTSIACDGSTLLIGAPGGASGDGKVLYFGNQAAFAAATPTVFANTVTSQIFGRALASIGDIDSDGGTDFAVGGPGASRVEFFRTGLGVTAYSTSFGGFGLTGENTGYGARISPMGVVFGGSAIDLAVAYPGGTPAGFISIISVPLAPATPTVVATVLSTAGTLDANSYGQGLASVRSINGDPEADLAIGAPSYKTGPFNTAGRVQIYDVKNGATIAHLTASAISTVSIPSLTAADDFRRFGFAIADLGDLNGDSVSELIIGSPGSGALPGQADIFDGAALNSGNRTVLCTLQAPTSVANDRFGAAVGLLGDTDLDGRPEFAVGSPGATVGPNSNAGSVYHYEFSGGACVLIAQLDGTESNQEYGTSITTSNVGNSTCNIDPLPAPDWAIGSNDDDNGVSTNRGSAEVYRGATPTPTITPTPTVTPTSTPTSTLTPSPTPTNTSTPTVTPTPTSTPTRTPSATPTTTGTPVSDPSLATFVFRITKAGEFSATLDLDSAPNGFCEATLFARAVLDGERTKLFRVLDGVRITSRSSSFSADGLPKVLRLGERRPKLYLSMGLRCGADLQRPRYSFFTEPFGRFLDCNRSLNSATPGQWVTALTEVLNGRPVPQRRKNRRARR